MKGEIDLGLGLLDHQLIDSEGRRCGKVDDLELEGLASGKPLVVAILVGAPAWSGRGRFARLVARLAGGRLVRVPWSEVANIGSSVVLKRSAQELRLGRGDERARAIVERIPGSSL